MDRCPSLIQPQTTENDCRKLTIYLKSSEDMKELEDKSISLIITSPPYFNYIDYGSGGIGSEPTYAEYLGNMRKVIRECYRVLEDGRMFCINITNMKSRKAVEGKSFLYPLVSDITVIAMELGFVFFDEIIWIKGNANNGALKGKPLFGSYPYPPTPKILDSIFEHILIFRKGYGKPKRVSKEIKEKSRLTKQEWQVYTKGVWYIEPDRKAKHPAVFPLELPYRLVKMYSFYGETVLDPFAGTGTTLLASVMLGRNAVGYEINKHYVEEMKERIHALGLRCILEEHS